jgi:hypothetical protein
MKTLQQIKQLAKKGDYTTVAELVGKSPDLVRRVVDDDRTDHHNIQKTFSDLLEARERLATREHNRRERKRIKLAA